MLHITYFRYYIIIISFYHHHYPSPPRNSSPQTDPLHHPTPVHVSSPPVILPPHQSRVSWRGTLCVGASQWMAAIPQTHTRTASGTECLQTIESDSVSLYRIGFDLPVSNRIQSPFLKSDSVSLYRIGFGLVVSNRNSISCYLMQSWGGWFIGAANSGSANRHFEACVGRSCHANSSFCPEFQRFNCVLLWLCNYNVLGTIYNVCWVSPSSSFPLPSSKQSQKGVTTLPFWI